MGLKSDIQTDIANAFDGDLADAVKTFTISKDPTQTYDAATGGIVTGKVVSFSWRGVFTSTVKTLIVDGAEVPVDTEIIALQNEATSDPTLYSYITQGDTLYEIMNIGWDPANCTYMISCRAARDG